MKNLQNIKPLVAILRGVQASAVLSVAELLVKEGFDAIEVPLNSPDPLDAISLLAGEYGETCLIGAGTVLTQNQVQLVYDAGGQLIVSPNTNPAVIRATKQLNMESLPGCASPTEAFSALAAGADGLKFFPAGALSLDMFKSLSAVLPAATLTFAVGGVDEKNMQRFHDVGITGFGLGSSLFTPDKSMAEIQRNARASVHAFNALTTVN